MIELNKYLNQFDVPTEIKMWIQSSLAIGLNLNQLVKVGSRKDGNGEPYIDEKVKNIIELIIATSRVKNLQFRYGSQDYHIRNGGLLRLRSDNEEDV